jgi:glycosyltransferase involved in cell wall biosynthesis
MLAGCAVVAYDTGALPEVVGNGGLLVREGDITELSNAISKLSADAKLRREISARGRQHALSSFDPAALAGNLVAFWGEVLER